MSKKTFIKICTLIFFIIGVIHLLRLIFAWQITAQGWIIPMWISIIGTIVPIYLAYSGFRYWKK